MDKESETQKKWVTGELEKVTKTARDKGISPLIIVWSYLRFSNWLNFQWAANEMAATSLALQIMAGAVDGTREEESTHEFSVGNYLH